MMQSVLDKYQLSHQFDNEKTVVRNFIIDEEKAQYLYKNINIMDEVERRKYLINLLDDSYVLSELYRYELKCLNLDKRIADLNELANFMETSLRRYHMKAGGHLCEDTVWTKHDKTSNKYPLKENEIVFENSIKYINRNDSRICEFITDLLHFFNIHMSDNLSISYRMIECSDMIYWMVFKIKTVEQIDEINE